MKTVGDSRAESPRAVEVWEVTRAAEHATDATRAAMLAVGTGEEIAPALDEMERAVLGALGRMPRGVYGTATELVVAAGYRNRQIIARVLRGLEHAGLARRTVKGWALTPAGQRANAV